MSTVNTIVLSAQDSNSKMSTVKELVCLQCNITFSHKSNLFRHQRNIHEQNDIGVTRHRICSVCKNKFKGMPDLFKHIQKEHPDIKLQFHEKIFYYQSDFEMWKAEIESESVSNFVVYSIIKHENIEIRRYNCHRSGLPVFKADCKRKRHRKISGSNKIGFTCPSMMKTTKHTLNDGIEILVEYQSTHLGHECEVDKLPLKKEERCILAGMLSAGMPSSIILEKIKQQYSPTVRLGQTTKQDLYNVRRDFNIPAQRDIEATCNQVCSVCGEKCRTILDMHKHIQKEHTAIKLEFQEKVFNCQSDFDQWKAEFELESLSSFTLHHMKTYEDLVVRQYRCHGSDLSVLKRDSVKKRQTKRPGSIKSVITCPSVIKTTKRILGDAIEILVEYQSTHLGHSCEVGEMPLAGMLNAGIPTSNIHYKTGELHPPMKRLGHATKQDLNNVSRDINASNVVHEDDVMAVDVLVRKMIDEGYNQVVVYEPLGENQECDMVVDVSDIEISQNEERNLFLKQHEELKMDLDNEKLTIKEYLQSIFNKVEEVESVKDLTYVLKNHLNDIQAYLDSSKTSE